MNQTKSDIDRAVEIIPITRDRLEEAVDVISDAFAGYPVMRYVLAEEGDRLEELARDLTHYFVSARILRKEPALGLLEQGELVAAATISPPEPSDTTDELDLLRAATWQRLGTQAKARYDELVVQWQAFSVDRPNYHVNMIGVRQSHMGRGHGRRLLEAIHHMSQVDPNSDGVTLTTEDSRNVPFYEHFGYEIVGQFEIDTGIRSWGFFRPNEGYTGEVVARGNPAAPQSAEARRIIALEEAMGAAIFANDPAAVRGYLHEEWVLVGEGGSMLARDQFLDAIAEGTLVHTRMDFDKWRVKIVGDTAVATCIAWSAGRYGGHPFQTHERSTSVYAKTEDGWTCILTQLTPIPEE